MEEGDEHPDAREEIARLEARIEDLADTIERCRKFTLASRAAIVIGVVVLTVLVAGAIRFDAAVMLAAIAAVLGGVVLSGSNRSTAQEAAIQLEAAEARRAALIDEIEPRVVNGRDRVDVRP